ncbi:NAD binding oxidoreductase [Calocera viscosa TUFC12733]|uniref:D-xylose 1-dehydrogenase (NADP(+), D-xylono-1,5-lactone-forming) n=1 Tax=Calocera viscosa (strain TUFC12733) TaxID=1330018 RepID=A0A167MVX8_CALVF|nr:NAD binding oxidoreductase [Calocera viscosa TUFC12733]
MAMVLQMSTFLHQYLYSSAHIVPVDKKSPMVLRFGILGASAMINPAAIIHPIETHNECVVAGFASRDKKDAEKAAKMYGHGVAKAYGSYEQLLADENIDAVYIPLPNGMHYEWASKALDAGKHVLLEKPFTSNAKQARKLVAKAEEKQLVLLEGFHWQFHPAAHAMKAEITSGKFGKILRSESWMTTPAGSIPKSDIRWKFDLAGGALMDMTYVVSATRYYLSAGTPSSVVSAKARPYKTDPRVDSCMEAELTYDLEQGPVKSKIVADMDRPNLAFVVPRVWELPSIEIETERAVFYYYNFMMPHLYHYISITDKKTGHTTYQKHYRDGTAWSQQGEAWWSTYRWQLQAFLDKIRGRVPHHWVTGKSSIDQMETIDAIYEKAGLPLRP